MNCCPLENTTVIKQGSTVTFQGQLYDDNNLPLNLTGVQIASQVRDSQLVLVQTLSVIIPDQTISPGLFFLDAGEITTWPIDNLVMDVRVSIAGVLQYTQTINIIVEEAVTQ